jgi:hypothetical protein
MVQTLSKYLILILVFSLIPIVLSTNDFIALAKPQDLSADAIASPSFFTALADESLSKKPETTSVPKDWQSQIQKNISDAEYFINWQEKKQKYSSPNRAQNLRFDYSDNGFLVTPRDEKTWTVSMTLESYGKAEMIPFVAAAFTANKNKGESEGNGVTITYENSREGMRQNFLIKEKPEGDGPLKLNIDVNATLDFSVLSDGSGIGFRDIDGQLRYRYAGLKVMDARGMEINAAIQKEGEDFSIVVNDAQALYPILIDPLSTSADWILDSNMTTSPAFGSCVSSAGDVNGDGYSDVIVGATFYDNNQADEGRAYVYYGGQAGLSNTPSWTYENNRPNSRLGSSIANAGDVNGDGYSDIIVGAYYASNGNSNEGIVYVFHGSATGLSATPDWTMEGEQNGISFGTSVASAGDVNGDGFSDVVIGADGFDNGETNEGKAFVFHGSDNGLSLTVNWAFEGNLANASFGSSVAGAGDVNGDGYSDVIVGAPGFTNVEDSEGRAFAFYGGESGLSATANWTRESNQIDAYFGNSVSSAGDVNGDGYSDVIVGAYYYQNSQMDEGRAFVYHGGATGLANSNWTAESNLISGLFGRSVSAAGDVNGDGYSDVIVGAYISGTGKAYVYQGSSNGLSVTSNWTAPLTDSPNSRFGSTVASAGDVNGDGFSEVIVGASWYDNGQANEGAAFIYSGGRGGLPTVLNWGLESDLSDSFLGCSVASAGDVNGDGYSDVIVGAYSYDNGQPNEGRAFVFHGGASGLSISPTPNWSAEGNLINSYFGAAVASAGDVNGDGYSDVIVGAYNYSNSENGEGRAFVYLGSSIGLSITSAWTAESDQVNANFGRSVASAGDVNGDGYSDVIVGAVGYDDPDSDEGRVHVYHGGPTGLSVSPNWTAESDQASSYFGYSVASAGDVNGDGYSDVIVGAATYEDPTSILANEGTVFVYHGGPSGLSSSSNWSAAGGQAGASFGLSVASAGDVNGDGYSDVIVGAFTFDNTQTNDGRAQVFHGSSNGLSVTANWTVGSTRTDASFGFSVASAGDVNGDGYSDVIVGAKDWDEGVITDHQGGAFVYLGSSLGLSLTSASNTKGTQLFEYYGTSVAGAGDVNGDGYSDVIVGSPNYDEAGQTDEGKAFVYYGNNGGAPLAPRLFRDNLSTPIQSLGRTHSTSSVGAGIFARSFEGRTNVKVQYEVKPLGVAFDESGLVQSSAWTDPGAAGTIVNQVIPGLSSSERYKIRIRALYDPVQSIHSHSRWVYPQGNSGLGETDFLVTNVDVTNEPISQSSNILFPTLQATSIMLQWTAGSWLVPHYLGACRPGGRRYPSGW